MTFNMFSAPVGYDGPLKHTPASLARVRETMIDLLASYPEQVLFSNYNAVVHTHQLGLDAKRSIIVSRTLAREAGVCFKGPSYPTGAENMLKVTLAPCSDKISATSRASPILAGVNV